MNTAIKKPRQPKATQWPNKLGWSIQTEHGEAEVRDLVNRLRAFVPMAELRDRTEHYKVADFPIGTDPATAVRLCGEQGFERGEYGPFQSSDVPFIGA